MQEGQSSPPWYISGVDTPSRLPPKTTTTEQCDDSFCLVKIQSDIQEILLRNDIMDNPKQKDLREIIKMKADKHKEYYKKLTTESDDVITRPSEVAEEMACPVIKDILKKPQTVSPRQRRTGVYEMKTNQEDETIFKSVKLLRENYLAMLQKTVNSFRSEKPSKDDSLLLPPPSGYCSSSGGVSDDERDKTWNQVKRCGSSDSAVGHSDEENSPQWEKKEDALSYKEAINSPYSPRGSIDHENVPSRTLIEAQFVPFPIDRKCSDCVSDIVDFEAAGDGSRRQSCFTDDGEEQPRYRYWRTPSVVVSDYSDDILGLTLEDIEYIRSKRKENSSSPDSSIHSSCSNLNYCGSTISSLDSEYVLRKPFRKNSNTSTCSTLSGDEDDSGLPPNKHNEVGSSRFYVLFDKHTPTRKPLF